MTFGGVRKTKILLLFQSIVFFMCGALVVFLEIILDLKKLKWLYFCFNILLSEFDKWNFIVELD